MPYESVDYLGEVLGEPASQMRNPVNAGYQCPFVNRECTKRSHYVDGPFPVCSVFTKGKKAKKSKPAVPKEIVCVCPNRLFQADVFNDIVQHCWPGDPPQNYNVAKEVNVPNMGKIDCVLTEPGENGSIKSFVSVELQAVDITGSYSSAYNSHINSLVMEKSPTYNFNWMNVYKRYITQLIHKGFAHHHWGTRIVAVMQDKLVDRLWGIGNFQESAIKDSNIVFMSYKMTENPQEPGRFNLELIRPIGTNHMSLMNSVLYKKSPSKEEFLKMVEKNMLRFSGSEAIEEGEFNALQ